MKNICRLMRLAILITFNFTFLLNTSGQKFNETESGEKEKARLKSWPRQKITHELNTLGRPTVVNFKALAEDAKLHPHAKTVLRAVEQGEDLEEKFKYKPRRIPAGSPVFNISSSSSNRPLIESAAPLGSFNGTMDDQVSIPPDIQGAAGPLHIMETTNQEFDIFSKSGTLESSLQIFDFFNVVPMVFYSDPHILYDANYQRYVICILDELSNSNSGLAIAVSETNDPTGNWYVYSFDTGIPFTGNTLLDYPELGYNNNWVVITGNDYETSGIIGKIYVMDRAGVYAGTGAAISTFTDNNAFTWVPAQTYDLNQNVEYMVQGSNGNSGGAGYMQIGSITGTAAAPVYNVGTDVGVSQTWSTTSVGAAQAGSTSTLESGDTRVMNGVVYINNSLWFTHNVFLPANNPYYIGVDWWQVNPATLGVLQYGRIADDNGNTNYFYPSLNVNSSGDALLEYCISGTDSFYPSAAYSFHAGSDPANTMQSRYIFKAGQASYYKTAGGNRNRWGDFTGTSVDPTDNSFWTFGQWAQTGNNWGTQIAHVAPSVPPALPPVANFTANNVLSNCTGLFQFTDLSTESPTSWSWTFGDGTTSNLQNPAHEYTTNGTYTVTLTATNAYGQNLITFTDYITVQKPSPPAAVNVSNCGSTSFSLSASTSNPVTWYNSAGNKVSATNPYTTPVLSQTTTYYVEDTIPQGVESLGPANINTLGAGGDFDNSTDRYLEFDAYTPFTLVSVLINAESAGSRTIALRNSAGLTLQSATVNLVTGNQTVTLNFQVPTGTALQLAINGTANLYRNNGGTTNSSTNYYPFTIAGLGSITGSNAGPGYYYYFYNWQVQSAPCISARTPVVATINPAITTLSPSVTGVLCNGGSTGSVSLSPGGGTPDYKYKWSTGQTTSQIINLTAGNYQVTVTDAATCSASASVTVTEPQVLKASASSTASNCSSSTGTALASPTGGTGNYSYHWNTGATTANLSNLTGGNYSVTVTDAHTCTATAQTTVISGSVNLSVTATGATCFGSATGSATASVTGDPNQVHYTWSTGATTATLANVVGGNYQVTAADASGCSATAQQTISQPSEINISVTINNNVCGTVSGSATALPAGGNSGYSYLWSTSATTATISNLAAATYHVTVTDSHSCTATSTAVINNTGSLNLNITPTAATCFGTATGSAVASVIGDVNTVNYKWSNDDTTASITDVPAGNYIVTATDNTGCSAGSSITISQPQNIFISISINNNKCGSTGGSAIATPSGGNSGFTYLWSTGATTAQINNLEANTYNLTVTDARNCTATSSANVSNTGSLNLSVNPTSASCFGASTGSATANVTGDVNTVSYQWNNNATTANITNVSAGNYSVTATDNMGCSAASSTSVSQPQLMDVSVTAVNISCGATTGSATAGVTGGNGGYTYLWSNGLTTASISNLAANTYQVTATDIKTCTATATTTIIKTGALNLSVTPVGVACYGSATGSATASVLGDANQVSYVWSNQATTPAISNVLAGNYMVTASDNTGCSATGTTTISQPQPLVAGIIPVSAGCGMADGSATANPSGGNSGYTYLWSTSSTAATISGLTVNTYYLTVTDSKGCTASNSVAITGSSNLSANFALEGASCFSKSDGSATANVTTGSAPFKYQWSNGATTATINGLAAGGYILTITDNNGCQAVDTIVITQPQQIVIAISGIQPTCNGGNNGSANVQVIGGNSSYRYLWSNNVRADSATNLTAGIYTVTVFDLSGCSVSASDTLQTVSAILTKVNSVNDSCYGAQNGSIHLSASGGIEPYGFAWTNGSTGDSAVNLLAGNYTVTITDANNCSATSEINISQPAQIQVHYSSTPANAGQTNGSATIDSIEGGIPPFHYNWSSGQTTAIASNLAAGNYNVTVTDQSGCDETATVTVKEVTGIISAGEDFSFNIYPNPARSEITVECNLNGRMATLTLKDILGQTLMNASVTDVKTTLNLSNYADGVYFVELNRGDKKALRQVVVSK